MVHNCVQLWYTLLCHYTMHMCAVTVHIIVPFYHISCSPLSTYTVIYALCFKANCAPLTENEMVVLRLRYLAQRCLNCKTAWKLHGFLNKKCILSTLVANNSELVHLLSGQQWTVTNSNSRWCIAFNTWSGRYLFYKWIQQRGSFWNVMIKFVTDVCTFHRIDEILIGRKRSLNAPRNI